MSPCFDSGMIDTPSARDSLYRNFPLSRNADKQNPAASAIFPDTSGTHPHRETSQETASRFEGNRAQLPRIPMNESLLHIDIGGAKWIPRIFKQQYGQGCIFSVCCMYEQLLTMQTFDYANNSVNTADACIVYVLSC